MYQVFIALGSNMGERLNYIQAGFSGIERKVGKIVKKSSIITFEPWGNTNQDNYLNAVCLVETSFEPHHILDLLISIELENKRERLEKWGPRTLDLDLLMIDDIVLNTENLILPHPFMHERLFVLIPLEEIAPHKIHPVLQKTIRELRIEL